MKLTTPKKLSVALAALTMLATAPLSAAELGETGETIKIAKNEWTGQHLSAHLAGAVLEKMGYTVEYVTAGAVPQFAAISTGDIHLQPETWTNNVGEIYPKAVESGDIVVVGELGLEPKEGWMYPAYMEEQCPGLPEYKALFDCAQAFAAADTFPKGRLITYPADWGTRSKDMVDAIGIPFQAVAGGSEGAMVAELKSAVDAEKPMLMMFWAPHWVHAEVKMNWVEWPEYEEGCDTDKALGINPQAVDDCGFQQASIAKITSKDFASKWPAANEIVKKLQLSNDAQNGMILEVDNNKRDVDEVVADWMEENSMTVDTWIENAKE